MDLSRGLGDVYKRQVVDNGGKIRIFYLSVENQLNKRVVIYCIRKQDTGSTPVISTIKIW
jgi:hypothetical protein